MFHGRLQGQQVNNVYDANLDVRNILVQERDGCQSLQGGNVSGAGHDHVGFAWIAGPLPDAKAARAMAHGGIHIEPRGRRLLAGDD